jgi:His/Glu/Gln/Arg/opine family amino acid ABC transporter permease subunit
VSTVDPSRVTGLLCRLAAAFVVILPSTTTAAAQEPLRVALTGTFPPMSFVAPDGRLDGFDVGVAMALGHELDREVEFVTTEWDGILAGLLARRYDAIVGSMAITPERSRAVTFTTPYYISGPQVFVPRSNPLGVTGLEDLEGRRVGVGLGETYEHYLRRNHPEIVTVPYKRTVDIFQDMTNGRLDAFLTDRLVGRYQVTAAKLDFVAAGDLIYRERIAVAVHPDDERLAADIDRALAQLRQRGELAALETRWFGPAKESTSARSSQDLGLRTPPASSSLPPGLVAARLARGFGVTLLVAAGGIGAGLLLAIPLGLLLYQAPEPVRGGIRAANDFIRATPLLIQLFFVYFGAPQVGIGLSALQAAVFTLAIHGAAFMGETIRAGLLAVPRGQRMAARALGLRRVDIFRFVVWPQAFRVALPPLVGSVVALIKDTALVSVISVSEVVREAQSIISVTYDPMLYYAITAGLFFAVTFPLMKLATRLEARIAARGYAA